MPAITQDDFTRMRNELLFDGPEAWRKTTRFWTLLVLAAVIATAGIIADSTATVIGAMIVAPLMTPILGVVFSIVSGDGRNIVRSLILVALGASLVIAIAWAMGQLSLVDIASENNSQVAGRVHPRDDRPCGRTRHRRGRRFRSFSVGCFRRVARCGDRHIPRPAARRRWADA
jgi:hypothetical protein